jgi:dolichyl-phosphate beta-glucosyltransferase
MMKTVVVPCFNEARRLQPERFLELERAGLEVLFVNDGSSDATLELLQAFAASQRAVSVISLNRNSGKAEAVRQGLLEALNRGARVVGYLDADLATPPSEMLRIVDALNERVLISIGSRVALLGRNIERSEVRHYLGRVFATAASLALGLRVYDTQCGAKAFASNDALRHALEQPFSSRWAFDVELLARLRATPGFVVDSVVEVPLLEWRDVKGSKLTASAMVKAGLDVVRVGMTYRSRFTPTAFLDPGRKSS